MENYRRLKVSAKARLLTVLVYRVTAEFPPDERYAMTQQMRKAAVGVGLAIAEGCGRGSTADLIRFLTYANGSAQEVEFAAEQSIELGFSPEQGLRDVCESSVEIQKMLGALIRALRRRSS